MRVLAIDPGLMTGLSCFNFVRGEEPVLQWSAEVTEDEFIKPIRFEYNAYPSLQIVCERFVITTETAKKAQAPFSLELIGALKQEMRDRGHNPKDKKVLPFQAPRDAMAMFDNPKLKKLGYWHKGGAGHANDSIRHGLLYLTRNGWVPSRLLD